MNHDCTTNQQGRLPCTCSELHTANSDHSSPHDETRDLIEVVLDMVLVGLALASVIFFVFAAIGFFSTH